MAKQRKQEVYFPPLSYMAIVALHSVTFGAKKPCPLHELCFTSDPPTLRGSLRGLAFTIAITPVMLLWVLTQLAMGIALLMFIAVIVTALFRGL